MKFGKKIHKKEWALTGHPGEIIFKYMRLIALSRDEKDLELKYAKKMSDCLIYHGATEDVVCKFGEIEVMNKMGNIERRDILSLELCGELAENYCAFADLVVCLLYTSCGNVIDFTDGMSFTENRLFVCTDCCVYLKCTMGILLG